jgi:hypothetical protein
MHRSRASHLLPALLVLLGWSIPAGADASKICDGAPNSVGPGATMRWAGTFQPENGELRVDGLPAGTMGMVLYSYTPTNVPFGNGTLCIGVPVWVLARTQSDASGQVRFDINEEGENEDVRWLEFAWRAYGLDTWFFQYWYRDGAGGGAGNNLSDAIRVTFE